MEQILGHIPLHYTDVSLNSALSNQPDPKVRTTYTRHFNHSEEFFLRFGRPFVVPSFPVHHDVRRKVPLPDYMDKLRTCLLEVHTLVPELLGGLNYLFDPAEVLRPAFYRLYRAGEQYYMYLLRLDLTCRPQIHTVIERGTNDMTPSYRSHELVLEADLIPLTGVTKTNGAVSGFRIDQLISDTWIGETGRGYFVQGIWLDAELTKFFSKLVMPAGRRLYPYYPFSSKFRTITGAVINIDPEGRKATVPVLQRTREFLGPHIEEIQEVLRGSQFAEDLPLFTSLRTRTPAAIRGAFAGLHMQLYLNDQEMREFEVTVDTAN